MRKFIAPPSQPLTPDGDRLGDALDDRRRPRRTAGHVDVDREVLVDRRADGVALAEDAAGDRADADGDRHLRIGDFGEDALRRRQHMAGQRAGDQHDVGVARAAAIDAAEALDVVARNQRGGGELDVAAVARTGVDPVKPRRARRDVLEFGDEGHDAPPAEK